MRLPPALQILRISQWIKNILIFAAILFAQHVFDPHDWLLTGTAFFAFCLVSSAFYIYNDLFDIEQDRIHPDKRHRPLARGAISKRAARLECGVVLAAGVGLASTLGLGFLALIVGYALLQLLYNSLLKHCILADVACIAAGFVLRAVGGAIAIDVFISPWLVICTFCLCVFIGFCKRYCELHSLQDANPSHHRKTLDRYTQPFLRQSMRISGGIAILLFLLYTASPQTVERFGSMRLAWSLPMVIFCVYRMAKVSIAGRYSDPVAIVFGDRPLQIGFLCWLAAVTGLVLFGG